MGASGFPGNRLEPMRGRNDSYNLHLGTFPGCLSHKRRRADVPSRSHIRSGNQIKGAIASSGHARVESLGKEMSIMLDS
jgi:hypothetical protein